MPGIEVRAEHDDLVRPIAPWDLPDDVVRLAHGGAVAIPDLDLDLDRNVAGQHSVHAVVVLGRDGDDGH